MSRIARSGEVANDGPRERRCVWEWVAADLADSFIFARGSRRGFWLALVCFGFVLAEWWRFCRFSYWWAVLRDEACAGRSLLGAASGGWLWMMHAPATRSDWHRAWALFSAPCFGWSPACRRGGGLWVWGSWVSIYIDSHICLCLVAHLFRPAFMLCFALFGRCRRGCRRAMGPTTGAATGVWVFGLAFGFPDSC